MRPAALAPALAALIVLGACSDEAPTGIGGDLIPGGAVRTFEVVLDAARFLAVASDHPGFGSAAGAGFLLVARDYVGTLDAHALARFGSPPASIIFPDTAGRSQVDTLPTFLGGALVLRVDTVLTRADEPVLLTLWRTAQEWDPATATWTLRVDSGTVERPWAEPGGTRGALVDSALWEPGTDSVVFDVDSATAAAWTDTTDAGRGALIAAETAGARLHSPGVVLRLQARPSPRPDTLITANMGAIATTFVFDPPSPEIGALQVGGAPAWRSFLEFQDRLDTLTLVCPPEAGSCAARLADAEVSYAALLLSPASVPEAFQPEDSMFVEARAVFEAPGIPLARSLLSPLRTGIIPKALDPDLFSAAAPAGTVELPITSFVASLAAQPDAAGDDEPPPSTLALLAVPENANFGFGAFAPPGSAGAPRLRLIVTVATEVGIE